MASFNGRPRVLEYARSPDGADALAELLASQAHGEHALYAPVVRDPELADALARRGIDVSLARVPSPMWRVFERAPLARLAGVTGATSDFDLLSALVADATYWTSDRF